MAPNQVLPTRMRRAKAHPCMTNILPGSRLGRHRRTLVSTVLAMLCGYFVIGASVVTENQTYQDGLQQRLFSEEWHVKYSLGNVGCDLGRKSVRWRPCGFGSNALHLLNAWVYALVVETWDDLVVVVEPKQLTKLKCSGPEDEAKSGWNCLFLPMPHLCVFHSMGAWADYMNARDVSKADKTMAHQLDWEYIRMRQSAVVADSLNGLGVDHFGALAVMAKYLWNNTTPWLQSDVERLTNTEHLSVFREAPFVGLHIRRGDKVSEGEADKVATEEYLKAAVQYLGDTNSGDDRTTLGEIKSIWVAADDPISVEEVRVLLPIYFPTVTEDNVVWISGASSTPFATHSFEETFEGFAYIFADLKMLAAAYVFVGTFSSNISRMAAVLRESQHGWPRNSTISLDRENNFGLNY